MGARRTQAQKLAQLWQLTEKPRGGDAQPTLNLRVTNGVHDTGWMDVPVAVVLQLAAELQERAR